MFVRFLFSLIFVTFIFSQPVQAEEGDKEPSRPPGFLMVEGIVVANSYLASLNPKAFGGFCAVFCLIGGRSSNVSPVSVVSVEALSIYDMSLNTHNVSRGEIFKKNFIAWNIVVGILALTDHEKGAADNNKKMSFGFVPDRNGGALIVASRF